MFRPAAPVRAPAARPVNRGAVARGIRTAIRAALVLAALALPAGAEPRADPDLFEGIDAGLWCASDTGERETAPGTQSGYIDLVRDPVLRRETLIVPISPGTTFGIRARFAPAAAGTAQVVIRHPPFPGLGTTRQEMNPEPAGGELIAFYTFDFPHEEVPGPWTFTVVVNGEAAASVAFEAVVPGPGARPLDGCGAPELMS
ncbi:MAG: DUF3859 domain-containing protein [Hasllibacter sp.]